MCAFSRSLPWVLARTSLRSLFVLGVLWCAAGIASGADIPQTPRIDSVVPSPAQPQASDPAVIWCDDFDGPERTYTESQGGLDDKVALGEKGRSMLTLYEKGTVADET